MYIERERYRYIHTYIYTCIIIVIINMIKNYHAIFGWHYLSNAACLMPATFVLCVLCRVKDHHKLLHVLPPSKKTCVRQVALNKWFPLTEARPKSCCRGPSRLQVCRDLGS